MKNILLIILCLVMLPAYADKWDSIQGTYAITGKDLIDPDPKQRNNTHLRFDLTGQTAKDLYEAMQVESKIDECTEKLSKRIDNMVCYQGKTTSEYACNFSINIRNQTIDYGLAC